MRAATYDEDFFHSISSSSRGGQGQAPQSRGQPSPSGHRGGYGQPSPSRGLAPQSGIGGVYTPHYSFTPPQYYAPRVYLGGRGRGNRGGRGGRGARIPKKWYWKDLGCKTEENTLINRCASQPFRHFVLCVKNQDHSIPPFIVVVSVYISKCRILYVE